MAETVHELVARVRPDGISQTEDELDSFTDTFEDVSDQAGDTAENLSEFSDRWQGAMQVAATGLAVAATSLLSTVPIIGELAGGLFAIIESIGLKMDKIARKFGVSGDALYEFAGAIDETTGPMETLAGAAGWVVTAIAGIVGIVAAWGWLAEGATVAGALASAFGYVASAVSAVVSAIAAVVGGISAASAAIIIAIAAIIAIIIAYITNFRGFRDRTNEFIGDIIEFFKGLWKKGKKFFGNLVSDIVDAAKKLPGQVLSALNDLLVKGKALLSKLATAAEVLLGAGFRKAQNTVAKALNAVLSTVQTGVNRAINMLNRLPKFDIGKVNFGKLSTEPVTNPEAELTRRFAAIDRRKRNQLQDSQETTNRFAERQTLEIKMDPQAAKYISADLDENPANRGR